MLAMFNHYLWHFTLYSNTLTSRRNTTPFIKVLVSQAERCLCFQEVTRGNVVAPLKKAAIQISAVGGPWFGRVDACGLCQRRRRYLASALIRDRMINHRQMSAIPFNPKGLNLPPRWSIIHQLSAACIFLHVNESASHCWCLLLSGFGICFFVFGLLWGFFCNSWCFYFSAIIARILLYCHCKVYKIAHKHKMLREYPSINSSIPSSIHQVVFPSLAATLDKEFPICLI